MNYKEKLKKHIKKKYYKDDQKIIKLNIKCEEELYNHLDSTHETLSDNVIDYLNRSVETLLPLSSVSVMIENSDDINLKHFEKCLHIHYGVERMNHERIERKINRKKIFLLFVSLITFISFIFFENVINEIRSFVFTLAVWEFVDMLLYDDEEEEIKMYTAEILEKAKVIKNNEK